MKRKLKFINKLIELPHVLINPINCSVSHLSSELSDKNNGIII